MYIKKSYKKLSVVLVLVLLFSSLSAGTAFGATTTPSSCWAWGNNDYGQLGDGTTVDKSSPTQVGAASDWAAVSVGGMHTLALKTDGTLWAWGNNDYGELGDGATYTYRYSPIQIGTATWTAVSAGNFFSLAIKSDGTIYAWGRNNQGQLGDGTTVDKSSPTQVGTAIDWTAVSAGGNHTLARKTNGTLWAWGNNEFGQLGQGYASYDLIPGPIQVGTASDWATAVAGYYHNLALKPDGSLYTWGWNGYGQLGDGTTANKFSPTQVGVGNTWLMISGGYLHSAALAAAEPAVTVSNVSPISDINVSYGTALADVGLPATVGVTLSDGSITTLGVTWDGSDPAYDGSTAGTYAFNGTLSLTAGVTNPDSLAASVNVIVAAPVAMYTVTVSASPTEGGTVSGGDTYAESASVAVTATANAGYSFVNWTEGGNVVSTSAKYTFKVDSNRTLVANFQPDGLFPITYTVSVSAEPSDAGRVSGGGDYLPGAAATVTAKANKGYSFVSWTEDGNVVSTSAKYTFKVDSNRTLVADFQR